MFDDVLKGFQSAAQGIGNNVQKMFSGMGQGVQQAMNPQPLISPVSNFTPPAPVNPVQSMMNGLGQMGNQAEVNMGQNFNNSVVGLGQSPIGAGLKFAQTQIAQPLLQGFTGTFAQFSPIANQQIQQAYKGEQGLGWGSSDINNRPGQSNLLQDVSQAYGGLLPMLPAAELGGNILGSSLGLLGIEAPTASSSLLSRGLFGVGSASTIGGMLGALRPANDIGGRLGNIGGTALQFAPYGLSSMLPGGRAIQTAAGALIGYGTSAIPDLLQGRPIDQKNALINAGISGGLSAIGPTQRGIEDVQNNVAQDIKKYRPELSDEQAKTAAVSWLKKPNGQLNGSVSQADTTLFNRDPLLHPQTESEAQNHTFDPLTAAETKALKIKYNYMGESQPGLSIKKVSSEEADAMAKLNAPAVNQTINDVPTPKEQGAASTADFEKNVLGIEPQNADQVTAHAKVQDLLKQETANAEKTAIPSYNEARLMNPDEAKIGGTQTPPQEPVPSLEPKNKVELNITGTTEKEKIQSAIVNSERVKNEISVRGKDAYIAGTKLSPEDLKLAEKWQPEKGETATTIDELATKAQDPNAFKRFMNKITDYYDFRLATDHAVGGQTPMRENYLRQRWDLSKPEDLAAFQQMAAQRGVSNWDGYSSQPRIFNTYAEGEAAGFKRANPTILGDLKDDYGGASTVLSRKALQQGLQEAAPTKVSGKALGRTEEGKPFINTNIPGLEGMSLHPDVNKELQGFQPSNEVDVIQQVKDKGLVQGLKDTGTLNTLTSLYDHASRPMKQFLLNFSGFHPLNVSANYAGTELFNPVQATKGLGESVPAFFSEDMTQNMIDGFKDKTIPGTDISVFDAGLRSGVNMDRGLPAEKFNADNLFSKENLNAVNPFTKMSRAIFDRELYTLKLNLVDQVFSDGHVDPESPLGRGAAQEINMIMGEMNNRTQNLNPNTQRWLGRLFLAPQFTESKYKMVGDALTQWKDAGEINSQGNLARKAVIGKSIVMGSLATLGTMLATGKFPNLQQILTNYTVNPSIQTNMVNPTGHKQDITLPTTYISEFAKPVGGLLQGDTAPLTHYAEARLNPSLSTMVQAYTGQNYYGQPNVNPMSSVPANQQLATSLLQSKLPIGVQNVASLMQGKISPAQAALQIAGLKTTTAADDPTKLYFNALAQARTTLKDPKDQAAWDDLHASTKDAQGLPTPNKNPLNTPDKYQSLLSHPELYKTETAFQQSQPNHDPIWDAPSVQRDALMHQTIASKNTPEGMNSPESRVWGLLVPQSLYDARSKFFNDLVNQGVIAKGTLPPKNPTNTLTTPNVYETILANPNLIGQIKAVQTSSPQHDPLWDWTPAQIRAYMQAQVISKNDPGGDKATTNTLYSMISQPQFDQRNAYFQNMVAQGMIQPQTGSQAPQMPKAIGDFWTYEKSLPVGTGARTQALQSPLGQQALAFMQQSQNYTNSQRADMGLPLLNPSTGSSGGTSNSQAVGAYKAKAMVRRAMKSTSRGGSHGGTIKLGSTTIKPLTLHPTMLSSFNLTPPKSKAKFKLAKAHLPRGRSKPLRLV